MSQQDYMTEEYNGYTIRIQVDEDAENPRENCNLGTFLSTFRSLRSDSDAPTELIKECPTFESLVSTLQRRYGPMVALKVRGYSHGGIALAVMDTPSGQFACQFDSGWAGVIFATHAKIREEYGLKRVSKKYLERAREVLEGEIEELNQWLSGDVYGYIIEDPDGEEVDSCWGYYGTEYCLSEARKTVDYKRGLKESERLMASTQ